ncbi:hypothetical protein ACIBHY_20235 [Nonomuraea sp. NPDC050547]|uniref:hypothetical protein n=1 Tax=Nonomuraea sp. NPDC050547 TaxID=3364368 RepID=UPI0037A7AAA6
MEGRFLGSRPPYGYRLVNCGPAPQPGQAADGERIHRLELDEFSAPVAARLFHEYRESLGLYAIAEHLTADGIPQPGCA